MRVLVVDDDEAVRALLRAVLRDEGHAVECASDGAEARVRLEWGRDPTSSCSTS